MAPLPSDLRSQLEKTVITARNQAEAAARATLTTLAVERNEPFTTMNEAQRQLRRALRAKARQLGEGDMIAGISLLIQEIAYEQWHRMLFARFLAETHLLMHPEGVPVTLQDCAELAREEGAADGWELAARYAGQMLPGLFLADDPAVAVRFAPEHRHALERLVQALPPPVFTADDSLGWVYQFWQVQKKAEVNASGEKINSATIGPVTQLFTEDYMVKFLLHNSLGAWWAARHPGSPLIQQLTYLRWVDDTDLGGRHSLTPDAATTNLYTRIPATGTFPGWPARVAEVTMLDPCGGSGHFVIAGFDLLTQMRMEEEDLDTETAVRAVMRDNLFMLDIDPRCCQLATFNLLLAAWKRIGYRADLPVPNIACSGIAVDGQLEEWLALAGDDFRLRTELERLHNLFCNAPLLGSLINPANTLIQNRLFSADYNETAPLLQRALLSEQHYNDPAASVVGETTRGVLSAAKLLARQYTCVLTNVPYLGISKQNQLLRKFLSNDYPDSKVDLATAFVERCIAFMNPRGTTALVAPQSWLTLGSYTSLRKKLLVQQTWHVAIRLDAGAFQTISGEVVKPQLIVLENSLPTRNHIFNALDARGKTDPSSKEMYLRLATLIRLSQFAQFENPDSRIILAELGEQPLLLHYADSYEGIGAGDLIRFSRQFWELDCLSQDWQLLRGASYGTGSYSGMDTIIYWQNGVGELYQLALELRDRLKNTWQRGNKAWSKLGVTVNRMGDFYSERYFGEIFNMNVAAIVPKNEEHLEAIYHFLQSNRYRSWVRQIDQSLKITNVTLLKVPFDLNYWQSVADKAGSLPTSYSNDPMQWIFNGHPAGATDPLEVAVARLLGYRWPQNGDDELTHFADGDGIVCLPPVAGEQMAHDRLRALLAHAYSHPPKLPDLEHYRVGDFVPTTPVDPAGGWSEATQGRLLAAAGYGGKGLDEWLRDGFFEQHCRLFQNRPFIWHIWDGRKDGFGALVNYHKLDHALLDRLIYTYLGAWISDQRVAVERGEAGAEGRLVAALALQKKLELIRAGEAYDCDKDGKNCKSGYDIYVRWKSLHQQPIGWDPDLNDGVRLNSRPWVTAGVLRKKFTINWGPDRGKNPDGSERMNDLHFSRAQKEAARQKA